MSDLYLILRHRLDHVTDWVMVDTDVLKEARRQLGLSHEAVARKFPVSSKTYGRWENAGRVPRTELPRLAEILGLKIEQPESAPTHLAWTPSDELGAEIIARLERIESLLRNRPAS